jgi:hypothetical protein
VRSIRPATTSVLGDSASAPTAATPLSRQGFIVADGEPHPGDLWTRVSQL